MALLPFARRREALDPDMTRVERCGEPPDGAALARSVPPLKQEAHRRAQALLADQPGELEAQGEHAPLQRPEAGETFVL